ncbi:MAG: Antitoxin component of bacterial toxin-antitoxin system, MqsA [Pseudomonadota bacterium]|jgi:transcriptional regulator with XRE-family HTH domain
MTSEPLYWSGYILALRQGLKVNQKEMARLLDVDQASISRWERGIAVPSSSLKNRIADLAKRQGVSTVDDPLNVVRYSPFPVCLVDRNGMVIVVSEASLFSEGQNILEQVRDDEREVLASFIERLSEQGFWGMRCARLDQSMSLMGIERKVVAIPVMMSGELFCLFHKSTPPVRLDD